MRTLSATLLTAQKSAVLDPLYKITLIRAGQPTYTYDRTRILAIDPHDEQSYSQKATVYLNNADKALTAIDLKGYQAVISYGLKTPAGDEYSDCAPLTVIGQKFNSAPGELDCILIMEGIPDLMAEDRASEAYTPDDTDTKTVKVILTEIITATMACFSHCTPYQVVFDSEDSLINTYMPKSSFRVYVNGSRLAAIRRLLDYTGCTMLVKADGKIHIFVPTTAGTIYDYAYSLANSEHTFFVKAYQKSLVVPNYVIVKSYDTDSPAYSGYATDPSSTLLEKREYHQMKLDSSVQATNIAQAVILKAQIQAAAGSGEVPINAGAEILDYVQITDAREGDTRTGNIGYLRRRIVAKKKIWRMDFGFGGWTSYRGLLNDLATNSDTGSALDRLNSKNLYVENIQTENLDIAWIDPAGNIDLSKIGDNLDDLPDGSIYARVKAVHLDSGGLKIDNACIYAAGYDPSTKMTGTNLDDLPDGVVYRRVQSAALTAGGMVLLDQVDTNGVFGLVNKADISSGHILLSTTIKNGNWYDESGVSIDAASGIIIYGPATAFRTRATKTGADQCYMDSSGAICAGGGKIILDSIGLTIKGSYLILKDSNGLNPGSIFMDSSGNMILSPSQDILFSNRRAKHLLNPVDSQDAATKYYVDHLAPGSGDMTKAVYDTDDDGKVDYAEALYDGVYSASAADTADAITKKHTKNTDTALGAQSQDLNMNSHKISNVLDPALAQDVATKNYVDTRAPGTGDMLKSIYDTDNDGRVDKAESVDDGSYASSAASLYDAVDKKHYSGFDTTLGIQTQDLDMGTHKIKNVTNPAAALDAANKSYVDTRYDTIADLSSSRALDAVYQNTSGKTMFIVVSILLTSIGDPWGQGVVAQIGLANPPSITVTYFECMMPTNTEWISGSVVFLVPNNYYYRVLRAGGTVARLDYWFEYT